MNQLAFLTYNNIWQMKAPWSEEIILLGGVRNYPSEKLFIELVSKE